MIDCETTRKRDAGPFLLLGCSLSAAPARGPTARSEQLSRAATPSRSLSPAPGPAAPPPRPLTAGGAGRPAAVLRQEPVRVRPAWPAPPATIPAHAYGPPNELAVQLGGPRGDLARPARHAVPPLQGVHARLSPICSTTPTASASPRPGGGFAWDGRADSLAEQAKAPLLSPFEMANANPAERGRQAARLAVGAGLRSRVRRRGAGRRRRRVRQAVSWRCSRFRSRTPAFTPTTASTISTSTRNRAAS